MSDAERDEFLREANVAILGTVDAKGRPHGAPVWYLYDGDDIVVSTGRDSKKHRNVQANPNVSLVMDTKAAPYYAVLVQGTAEVEPPLSEDDRVRLVVRYLGEERGKWYADSTKDGHSGTVTLRVRPTKFVVYDSGMGRRVR